MDVDPKRREEADNVGEKVNEQQSRALALTMNPRHPFHINTHQAVAVAHRVKSRAVKRPKQRYLSAKHHHKHHLPTHAASFSSLPTRVQMASNDSPAKASATGNADWSVLIRKLLNDVISKFETDQVQNQNTFTDRKTQSENQLHGTKIDKMVDLLKRLDTLEQEHRPLIKQENE